MALYNFTKEKTLWIVNVGAIGLLTIFPFTSHPQGLLAIYYGDFSKTIWHLIPQMPVLEILLGILLVNAILASLVLDNRLKNAVILSLNLLAIILFIGQFLILTPNIALGGGSFLLFFTCLFSVSHALSHLRIIEGDAFISGSILSVGMMLIIFILLPLLVILGRSVFVNGAFTPLNFFTTLLSYPNTWRTLRNSLLMAVTVGVFSTAIGLAFALVVERSRFKYAYFLQGFSLLPIITPPFVIGLAIIFMLGRSGYLSHSILGFRSAFIFGFPGIVLSQTLSFAPMAYLILVGVIRSLNAAFEEASYTLGASRWHSFRTVIWPLIRPGIANAFLLSVIDSLADFANPILLGGDFDVLSTSIYLAIVGRYDEALAASLGIVLLVFTLSTFAIQRYWIGKRSYVTITGKPSQQTALPLPKALDYTLVGVSVCWTMLTMVLYGSVVLGGFVKLWGVNHTLTLMHYKRFLTDGLDSYVTTLGLSAISAPLTAIIGLVIAYVISRYQFFGKNVFEFVSMLSFAIPGTIIGIGYVMSFNTAPLLFTGTATIIVVCFIFRNMPVGIRSAMAALQQIDRSLEEASITLGASHLRTLNKIVIPLIRPAIFSGLVFSFVRAMTAISAVVFLVTARMKLATTIILARIEGGKLGQATAYCTIMIITMIAVILLMHLLVRRMSGVGRGQIIS